VRSTRAFATTTELTPWQRQAVEKVKPARVGGLFMEMGTGKSLTAIELVRRRARKVDRVIWFCPVSLKRTVYEEILKHTDCEDVYCFDDRTTAETVPRDVRWIVVGLESLSTSDRVTWAVREIISDRTFVILDESSYIKGDRAIRTARATLLSEPAQYRLILTGTPLSNGVADLFSQMKFLSPKILGYHSWYTFARNHLEFSETHPGLVVRTHDEDVLAAKIAPYVYQVTKAEAMCLPEKRYRTRFCSLTGDQQWAYERAKEEILSIVELDDFKPYTIFRLFTILQQIASGFWNRRITEGCRLAPDDPYEFLTFADRRLPTFLDAVADIPEREKVIVWAKFRYDIDRIAATLREQYGEDQVALFTGDTPQADRPREVERFRGPARFFVSTQSCGGHGLTLNEAHHAIFYSNGFKYSERLQAEDRCHRIGQEHEVEYIDIHAGGTIDDRIAAALAKKQNVAAEFRREVDAVKDDKAKLRDLVKVL
jgi:SNF2 family DNA or RNA helicase